jgi:hydrogenase maturation protease
VAEKAEPLLVLGLGNPLCQDDGVGVLAIARLLESWIPGPDVRMMEGGTLGMWLLPLLESYRNVLLVDAVRAEGEPGTQVRLDGADVARAAANRLSVHQVGISDLISAAEFQGSLPPKLTLVGVVPESIELGLGLTPRVERALPLLMDRVREACAEFGHPLRPRTDDETLVGVDDGLRRVLGMSVGVR